MSLFVKQMGNKISSNETLNLTTDLILQQWQNKLEFLQISGILIRRNLMV